MNGTNTKRSKEDLIQLDRQLRCALGRRISEIRIQQGISQRDLAASLGMCRSRLGKWESGSHAPPLGALVAIAEALDVSLDELVRGRAPEGPRAGALTPVQREAIGGALHLLSRVLSANAQPSSQLVKRRSAGPQ